VAALNGEIAARTSCCAGVGGPDGRSGSLTPMNSLRVLTRTPARLKGSERELERKAAELWTFRGDKVIHHKSYDSTAEGLEAAGLPARAIH